MLLRNFQQGTLITREAYTKLMELKSLVDLAIEKTHRAELETVGLAVNPHPADHPLQTLEVAAEALQSPGFENTVSEAKAKVESAVNWHRRALKARAAGA
jgi:hypothetical protein